MEVDEWRRIREEVREWRDVWRRVVRKEREGRESDIVWWVYEKSDTCHLISGALVVLDVLHWR